LYFLLSVIFALTDHYFRITTQPVLGQLLNVAQYTNIYFSWRPISPDAGDDLVIDCAMNAGAIVVTFNIRDFWSAKESLGLQVLTPVQFVSILASGEKS
jgi:hypothetical protein